MGDELLLVGSVPLSGPEEVFQTCGHALGDLVPCLPDGETGDRKNWIDFLALRVFDGHPDIETIQRPRSGHFSDRKSFWSFRVRPGRGDLHIDDMGYAEETIASYQGYRQQRASGAIAPGMRLQVGLPMPGSGVDNYFRDPADWDVVRPAYEDGLRREIARMLDHIPAADLAIQWDVCVELLDIFGAIPWAPDLPLEDKILRHVAPMDTMSRGLPEEILLGYHFCYGTLGGWPMVEMQDLALCVRLANEAVARSGRRVDFVHMPVIPDCDAEYFRPLLDLTIDPTRVYLGVIHHTDGIEGFRQRIEQARAYLPQFGVASVCGYGRLDAADIPGVLELHRACAELIRGEVSA
jgi:hypothetical protein